jgi:hypothetical protein
MMPVLQAEKKIGGEIDIPEQINLPFMVFCK